MSLVLIFTFGIYHLWPPHYTNLSLKTEVREGLIEYLLVSRKIQLKKKLYRNYITIYERGISILKHQPSEFLFSDLRNNVLKIYLRKKLHDKPISKGDPEVPLRKSLAG